MGSLHLGFDSSTQSLTAVVIDLEAGRIVYTRSINFDEALPKYETTDGVLRYEDPTIIHGSPRQWLDALDILFTKMQRDSVPLGAIKSVSGSGQQHGSVYLNEKAAGALRGMNPRRSLVENLDGIFSRPTAPVWMDSSTSRQCHEIEQAMRGHGGIIEATGSAATERFTGPQIRKFWQEDPAAYEATRHIALVSSFMCSVLSGKIAPIDPGDGAGMNLMDIRTFDWHPAALDVTAPDLRAKLPPVGRSGLVVGKVSDYFVKRYGLNPSAASVIWSGDNPCSVVGLGLIKPGMVAISMGTSYTYFGTMAECHVDPRGEGHVFGSPAGGYMTLNCFKNGGLARARIRDQFGLKWEGFQKALTRTPPGNHGRMMLPWYDTEIVPKVLTPGVHRLGLAEDDGDGHCRALVEAQMLAMRLHAGWMKVTPTVIYATGGASEDATVLQIMADVFRAPVYPSKISKSAATGAALIAAKAKYPKRSWETIVSPFTQLLASGAAKPDPGAADVYDQMIHRFAAFEQEMIRSA